MTTGSAAGSVWVRIRRRSIAAGVLLALAVGELVVRQAYFVPWEIDPDFGCIVLPGTTARYRLEGSGISRWTTHGVRAAQLPPPTSKPILALGDSFTEAYQVDDEEVYTHRLERQLSADLAVAVVNAGRSAASPADYVAYATRNRRVFEPRWVVIQLNEDDLTGDAWSEDKPHFVEAAGTLTAAPVSQRAQSPLARTLWHARQASALLNYSVIRFQSFAEATRHAPPLFFAADPPRTPTPRRSFDDAMIAAQLDAMAAAYAGRVTFLLLPPFDPNAPDRPGRIEQSFDAACGRHAWSCVSLRRGYRAFAEDHRSPFGFSNSGFNMGHLNPDGHRLAADLLADELRRLRANALL